MTLQVRHVSWCRNLFSSLKDGGCWGVPRSGLIFTRSGDKLVLTAMLPHEPGMPITKEQLVEQQREEYEGIKGHFAMAGIVVEYEGDSVPIEKPFRVEVVADSSGKWCSNGVTYPTLERAKQEGLALAERWTLVRNVRVVEQIGLEHEVVDSRRGRTRPSEFMGCLGKWNLTTLADSR